MDDISKYSNLAQFFGCYFHQDFTEEFGTPEQALNAFITDSDKELIKLTSSELKLFLSLKLNENDLTKALGYLYCDYLPNSDNLPIKEWLMKVSETMVLKCT